MKRSLIRALVALLCLSSVAQAQLGSLIKKAVENKIEKKATPEAESPPLGGDPVTKDALDAVLKGLAVELEAQSATAAKLKTLLAKQDEWRAADKDSRPGADAWRSANSKIVNCVERWFNMTQKSRHEAFAQKITTLGADPKSQELVKEYARLLQDMSQAAQKNDTAGVRRDTRGLERLMGADPVADSAAAFKSCGKPPAKPDAMVRTERLSAEADSLQDEFRKSESGRAARAAATAGMTADKYALARERLYTWYSQRSANEGKRSVTKDEDALFKLRLADIKKVEAALR